MIHGDYVLDQNNSSLALKPEEELKLANSLLNSCANAAFCLDAAARFVYANQVACWLLGYSQAELLSLRLHDVYLDFPAELWAEQWRSLQHQGPLTFNSRYQTKGGRMARAEVTIAYTKVGSQGFGCVFAYSVTDDILDAMVAQRTAELLETNRQLHRENSQLKREKAASDQSFSILWATLEAINIGIAAVSHGGYLMSCNQKFIELWRLPQGIVLSQNYNQCLAFCRNQLKYPEVFSSWIQALDRQPNAERSITLKLKDGRLFEQSLQPQRLHGQIVGRVWSVREIKNHELPEEAKKQEEASFLAWADTTDVIILIVRETQIRYINPAAEVLTGYTREELFVHPRLNQLIQRMQKRKRTESVTPLRRKFRIMTKSREECWLYWSIESFEFEGQPSELVIAIDITQCKRMEASVRRILKQEKELNQQRGQLMSMISHQFRTPLNLISFSTSLLERHSHQWTEEKKRPYLHHIQMAVQQLSQLMEKVLILSRLEAGKLLVEPKLLNLEEFCTNLLTQMELSDRNQHEFTFNNHSDCSSFYGDEKLLRPVLENLLENACKYSPEGSTIELIFSCEDKEIVFQVKDTGIGIPLADQQQLFEPFHRGGNVGNIDGTGLGLAVVQKLVDLYGGQVNVASEVGSGTTFTVKLPLL